MDVEQPKLIQNQEEPYSVDDVMAEVSTSDHSVTMANVTLQIGDEGISLVKEIGSEEWLTVFASFGNITSVGSQSTALMVFVGDNQMEDQEEMPQILQMIQLNKAANVSLIGNSFTIRLDLSKYGSNVVKQINDLMVNYLGDGHTSEYDQDQNMGEMICADDIDQNGNIIEDRDQNQQDQQENV